MLFAALAVVALVAPSCSRGDDRGRALTVGTISLDPPDAYEWQLAGSSDPDSDDADSMEVSVAPAAGNRNANLREVATNTDLDPSADHGSCATWDGPLANLAQPGVALRVRVTGTRVRAITITNNVFPLARQNWNVHLADSAADTPMQLVGTSRLSGFASSLDDIPPLPWRICARVTGVRVEAKVWPTAELEEEPGWDDDRYRFEVLLPEGSEAVGRPGLYLGHLSPTEQTRYVGWQPLTG